MGADHGSGAFAVDVEVSYVEFADGAIDLVARFGVDGAGQAELGVVGDFQRVVEAAGFNYCQHGAEDFFLFEFRLWRNVGEYRRLEEVAFAHFSDALAAGDEASIFLALLDVFEDCFHRAFVDHRAHGGVFGDIADLNFLDAGFELFEKLVVDALVNNDTRAGRAFLSLKSKGRLRRTFDGGGDVRVGVNDHGIFAAHFQDGALDPDLSGGLGGGDFVNVQSDFARAGEGDVAGLGMGDDGVAETGSGAGTKIHYAFGHAGFFEQFHKLGGDRGRIARRLQNHRVAADNGGQRHASHNGAGKIPRRNDRAYAQRNVVQGVVFAGQLNRSLRFRKTQGLARVELAEVDGLGNVGIGLGPVLADFEDQPCHVFHLALAHEIADAEDEAGALFDGGTAPGFERFERGFHGRFDVIFVGFLMDADDLRGLRRIQRLDLVSRLDALAADDEVILAAKLSTDFGDGGAHAAGVFFVAEIIEGLGDE